MFRLRADVDAHQAVCGCTLCWLASAKEVGTGPANGVLDHVGDEGRHEDAEEEAEVGDVHFVCARSEDDGPEHECDDGDDAGVYEQPEWRDVRGVCVGVLDVEVGEREEAVEWGREEL